MSESSPLDAATLRAIIGRAADTAATILNMSQGFHASDGMREYARVRAEALVEFSQGLAKLLKETEAAAPRPVAEQDEHDPLCSEGVYAGDQRMPCDCRLSRLPDPPPPAEAREWQPRTAGERLSYEQGHKDASTEIAALRAQVQARTEERDAAREQFDRHVAWASGQERQARADERAQAIRVVEAVWQQSPGDLALHDAGWEDCAKAVLAALRAAAPTQGEP